MALMKAKASALVRVLHLASMKAKELVLQRVHRWALMTAQA